MQLHWLTRTGLLLSRTPEIFMQRHQRQANYRIGGDTQTRYLVSLRDPDNKLSGYQLYLPVTFRVRGEPPIADRNSMA